MDKMTSHPTGRSSIAEIAASMVTKPSQEPPTPERQAAPEGEQEQPVTPAADGEETDQHAAPSDDGQHEPAEDEDQHEDPDGSGDAVDGQGDGQDGAAETFAVKVDGEMQEVSLADLKAAYSGNTVIAKRLQEATEARNEAVKARDLAIDQERQAAKEVIQRETETLRTQASQLAQVYSTYREALLAPQVEAPDPALRQSDPLRYLSEQEAYRQDQDRLRSQEAHMREVTQQAERMQQEAQAEQARAEAQKMIEEVPAMANPEYRKQQLSRVMEVGRTVGYTDAEIRAGLSDRRLVYLAMLAAEAAENIVKTRQGGKPVVQKSELRTPAPSTVARRTNGQFARKQAEVERARQTGTVKDVAASMIVSAPKTRGQSRRG